MICRHGLSYLKVITGRNRSGTKLSMLFFVLHHAFWELCIYLFLCFPALLPKHRVVRAIVHYVLLSRVLFVSPRHSAAYYLECLAMWNPAKWTSLQSFLHSSTDISIAETVYGLYVDIDLLFTCELVRHLTTRPYCNTAQPLASTMYKQELVLFTAVPARFTCV
jgi:hypothetical protein